VGGRGMHSKELHNLYSSLSIFRMIKENEMGSACSINYEAEDRVYHQLQKKKRKGKRPLGRPRSRWLDNIKMDLGEIEWGDVGLIGLAQDTDMWRAIVKAVINLQLP
jgi:hypothetical protein